MPGAAVLFVKCKNWSYTDLNFKIISFQMKTLFTFFLCSLFFCAAAQKQFIVDPDAVVREISGSFSSIKVSSGIHIYLSKGDEEVLAVSADDEKYKNGIKTEIINGVLHIFYGGEKMRYGNNFKMNVYIAYKNLEQIQASGASNVYIAGLMQLPSLNVQMSGASEFKGEINIGELNIKLSGASNIKLNGIATTVNIESSGASDVKAFDLLTETCNIKSSGASDVNITVSKEISANASGASNVYYKGLAELKVKQSSGASSIARVQ